MTTKAIRDIVPGDRLATTDPRVDAYVTHCYEAGHGVRRVPEKGGDPVPAWCVCWNWMGDYRPGMRHCDFYAPDDEVKLA